MHYTHTTPQHTTHADINFTPELHATITITTHNPYTLRTLLQYLQYDPQTIQQATGITNPT